MQYFDFTVQPGGGVQTIKASGRYVRYIEGSGGSAAAITLRAVSRDFAVRLKPGQAVSLPVDVSDWLVVGDRESAAVGGSLVIGDGRFDDDRLLLDGTVTVTDSDKADVLGGREFADFIWCAPANPANRGIAQLWNPAASTVRLVVRALQLVSVAGTPQRTQLCITGSQAGTLTTASASINNLRSTGYTLSQAEVRRDEALAPSTARLLLYTTMPADGTVEHRLSRPVVLEPGSGLNIIPDVASVPAYSTVQWGEVPL